MTHAMVLFDIIARKQSERDTMDFPRKACTLSYEIIYHDKKNHRPQQRPLCYLVCIITKCSVAFRLWNITEYISTW